MFYLFINKENTIISNVLIFLVEQSINPLREDRESIIDICTEFNYIFHLEGDNLTCTNTIMHEIKTTTDVPIASKIYRFPEIHKEEVNKQISKMLKDKIGMSLPLLRGIPVFGLFQKNVTRLIMSNGGS